MYYNQLFFGWGVGNRTHLSCRISAITSPRLHRVPGERCWRCVFSMRERSTACSMITPHSSYRYRTRTARGRGGGVIPVAGVADQKIEPNTLNLDSDPEFWPNFEPGFGYKKLKQLRTKFLKNKNTFSKRSCGGLRRCGGLWVVSLPLGRPAWVRILALGLPTVWSEGRQITL